MKELEEEVVDDEAIDLTWTGVMSSGDSSVDGEASEAPKKVSLQDCQGGVTYTWYWNNQSIHTGKTFIIRFAEPTHGGNYQCVTSEKDISEEVTLYVVYGPFILQSPPYIYEGDDLALRCHSRIEHTTRAIMFYRNNEIIHSSTTDCEYLYRDHLDVTAVYKCTRQFTIPDIARYSDEIDVTAPGSSASVIVTFSPKWKKIFTGDNITINCDGNHHGPYSWYKDNILLKETQKSFYIHSAQRHDSGKYQCGTIYGRSPEVSLEVSNGPVLLQAPLTDDGSIPHLRCHSRPQYPIRWRGIDKDGQCLLGSEVGRLYFIKPVETGTYRCDQVLYGTSVLDAESDPLSVPIRDLFSSPEIRLTPSMVIEGDHMTLTCDTRLSPHRQTTELQFAFYRDGREVRGFLPSNKYVLSAKLEDSGNYYCAGRTGDNRVKKVSEELHVQIYNRNYTLINIIRLITSGLIVIMGIIILYHHLKRDIGPPEEVMRPEDGNELENVDRESCHIYSEILNIDVTDPEL
ncbi:high affinity immunoglobulin gamma Fc receptor I-like [Leptodactylus fuscus]|uniref:high affinity immunoglobulin gamma Fc receptor I-like n=1 Tax=Leptodactylus fuscus TaxID=238119 RepID=UPI003F4F1D5B